MTNLSNVGNQIGKYVAELGVASAVGYLGTYAFTTINPLAGALGGAMYVAYGRILDPVFDTPTSTFASKAVGLALKIVGASFIAFKTFGIEFSLGSTLSFGAATVAIPQVVALGVALAISAVAVGAFAYLMGRMLYNMG